MVSRVVGVGLVQLERRELGIVARRDALVAEAAADLEHLVEAADDEPLEVELGRHAQVEVGVERVVVRDERARRRPAGDRMQQRRLHLDEAALPQAPAHVAHDVAAQLQQLARALVGPQVDLALAVARLDVADTVPLVAEAAPRLGQQHPLAHLDRELAPPRPHDLAGDPDPVAQVALGELLEARRLGRPREQLDRARAVAQLGEGGLALIAQEHDAAGHPDGDAGLLPGGERRPGLDDRRRVVGAREAVGDLRRRLGHEETLRS